MPKVVYSGNKGLVQETGSGFSFVTGTLTDKVGLHLYQEEVKLSAQALNKVIGNLSKSLPANSVIVQCAITTSVAGTGVCSLKIHSSSLAIGANTAGTEIAGANVSGDVSIPDANLDLTTVGHTVATNTAFAVTTNVYPFISSKVGAVSGSPRVIVSILYAGKGEPATI